MDRQNLTLLTDLYELTMMQGYFKHKDRNEMVIFDAFYRKNPCNGGYAIAEFHFCFVGERFEASHFKSFKSHSFLPPLWKFYVYPRIFSISSLP